MFGKDVEKKSEVKNYGQVINHEQSHFYYIPQLSGDSGKGFGSIMSYSAGGGDSVLAYNSFIGMRNCNCENIILVDKNNLKPKPLFDSPIKIESFLILDPKLNKENPEISKLMFLITKTNAEAPRRLSIAHLDGTGIKIITPENLDLTSLDFDLKRARAFVLLKKLDEKEPSNKPYMIDLKTQALASPLL